MPPHPTPTLSHIIELLATCEQQQQLTGGRTYTITKHVTTASCCHCWLLFPPPSLPCEACLTASTEQSSSNGEWIHTHNPLMWPTWFHVAEDHAGTIKRGVGDHAGTVAAALWLLSAADRVSEQAEKCAYGALTTQRHCGLQSPLIPATWRPGCTRCVNQWSLVTLSGCKRHQIGVVCFPNTFCNDFFPTIEITNYYSYYKQKTFMSKMHMWGTWGNVLQTCIIVSLVIYSQYKELIHTGIFPFMKIKQILYIYAKLCYSLERFDLMMYVIYICHLSDTFIQSNFS